MGARAVSVGNLHACAALEDGTGACWGLNSFGALGNGTTDLPIHPVAVKDLGGIQAIEAGQSQTCAIRTDGALFCWGSNVFGELANGPPSVASNPTPVPANRLPDPVAAIARSEEHALCAALTSGSVVCWAEDIFGLGSDTAAVGIAPTPVPGLTNARAVALGDFFGCALLADQTVSCWGSGALGQGDPDHLSVSAKPLPVPGLAGVSEIAAGQSHACARLGDGTVDCWGSIGFGDTPSGLPVKVDALSGAVSLAAGGSSTCVVRTDGTVRCLGGVSPSSGPIPHVAHAVSVSVGSTSACAVIAGGTVECWGMGSEAGLGDANHTLASDSGLTVVAPSADGP
jgi:alpha-tubulin suppressor-like RCC1 family protein